MTHQNHQTNGASLEDCHTNFFALTDLCGIKWRKFVNGERPNASSDPLEDPILRSYSRCMQADILCVWRRVQSTKQDTLDPNALSFEISSSKIHPPLSLAAAKELWIFWYGEEPDLNDLVDSELLRVAGNQMLWNGTWEKGLTYECRSLLFKALHNLMERFVLTKDIVRFGKWFVQPCTSNERIFGKSSQHLSFSFTFFVHGDTVCASIDLREHPAVRPLTKEHLAQAAAAFAAVAFPAATQSGSEQQNGSNNSGGGMLSSEESLLMGNNGVTDAQNVAPSKPRKVILAPFGMAATLTGNSYKATDPMAEKILDDWASFFPLCNKENSDVPPVVEVVSGGHKMYHPSMYVLVTDLDDMEELETTNGSPLDSASCSSAEAALLTAASAVGVAAYNRSNSAGKMTSTKPTTDSATNTSTSSLEKFDGSTKFQPYYETLANFTCNTTNTHAPPQAAIEMPERAWQDCITNPLLATTTATILGSSSNNNINHTTNTSPTTSTAGVSIKQEHIKMEVVDGEEGAGGGGGGNQSDANAGIAASTANSSNISNANTNNTTAAELKHQQQTQQMKLWNFVDPTQKAPCICTKCYGYPKKQTTGTVVTGQTATSLSTSSTSRTSLSTSFNISRTYSSSTSPQQQQQQQLQLNRSAITTPTMSTIATTTRKNRIPFHKRQHLSCSVFPTNAVTTDDNSNTSSRRSTNITHLKAQNSKNPAGGEAANFYFSSSSSTTITTGGISYSDTIPNQRSSPLLPASSQTPGGTPHGGASSYSRNSIGDSVPVPSVGSPSTPAPSPHPNSSLSQPTSVPPADQLMSPRAPTSVSNMHQPPTPIDPMLLDKNTPAPTPTDQHDNKSITASPYVQPTPSVEPPPSAEVALGTSGHGGGGASGSMNPGSVPPPPSVERCTPTIGQQQQPQQQQQQVHHQPTQQQCGLITVKKFETQLSSQTSIAVSGSSCTAASAVENSSTHFSSASAAMVDFLSLYKPPKLSTKDIENQANDDCLKLETLYDFTVQDAWVNHPVKRFKPNEVIKPCRPLRTKNLYDSHTHFKPLMPSPGSVYGTQLLNIGSGNSMAGIVRNSFAVGGLVGIASTHLAMAGQEAVGGGENSDRAPGELFAGHEIKLEGGRGADVGAAKSPCKEAKGAVGGNLFTAEGLNPSMNDLEQLFDTSSNEECGGVQIHTPPDSNNPSNGCATTNTIDDLKRSTAVASAVLASAAGNMTGNVVVGGGVASLQNCVGVGSTTNASGNNGNSSSLSNNLGANVIQAEDLTKMFPTPPSHEQHHPNSSPCQMDISMTDLSVVTSTTSLTTSLDVCLGGVGGGMIKIKQQQQEYSVELGSPVEEPIDDWSYVYKPPLQSKFVGSSKYAPLTNLPSQTLPPLVVPANCVYKPSWTTQQARVAAQQQHQQQQQQQQQLQQHQQQQQQHHHQQLQELLSAAPRTPLQQPRTPLGPMPSPSPVPPPLNSAGSNLLLNQLNCPQAALTNATVGGPTMQQLMQRAGMSPISPAAATVPFPSGSPMLHHQHPQQRRTTPIHPPPPYEVAVASPATSTSSYLNKQFHSQEPQPRTPQSVGAHPSHNSCHQQGMTVVGSNMVPTNTHAQRYPEISSLIVNVLLYDTALNVFRDHNFDSSTVCVCNADSQKVGNIRGADSGVYVPLPGSSFNPSASSMVAANGNTASGSNLRLLSAFGGGSALHSPASVPGAGSGHAGSNSSSSLTPTTTAAGGGSNQHINGYYDEDPVECTCGFSAVVNRRLAHRAGLFYEDEMEITGIAEDPGRNKKRSLLSLISSLTLALRPSPCNALMPATSTELEKHTAVTANSAPVQGDLLLANSIFDLLLEQCSIIQTSSSSIHRALQRYRRRLSKAAQSAKQPPQSMVAIANVLEFVDANDIMCLALEQARLAALDNGDFPGNHQQQQQLAHLNLGLFRKHSSTIVAGSMLGVHKWPYIPAGFSRSNKDIVRTMNAIQPMLQNAFHSKSRSAAGTKDATYTVSGPLTWRQFHRLAGRASGQCEPQPIPSVIVGQDKDWVSVAPLAIHYWDKFLLEPYSYARDVVYLIICPDNEHVIGKTRSYFKELSSTYEMCKLGRHTPMRGWDGLLSVGPKAASHEKSAQTTPLDDWLRTLEDISLAEKIRLYALAFQNMLVPYLNRVPNDKTLLNPPDSQNDGRCGSGIGRERGTTSPHGNNSNSMTGMDVEKSSNSPPPPPKLEPHATTSEQDQAAEVKPDIKAEAKPALIFGDPLGAADTMEDINPPAIVLYVVEPFTYGSDSPELERLACIALLRCYAELLKSIPDTVRANINLQIISMESMLELGRARNRKRFSDEIKCLALNIFSQCRRHMVHGQTVKSLTGFGTAANMEVFLKSKDEKNRQPYKMYTPPFILAPVHEKTEKTDFSRANAGMRSFNEQQYSVMYCNYCMSEDQSWLLATVTDNRGELLEKVCINIDVPNRTRRRKAPARRVGLKKLMDFIMGIISQTAQPWRLVIGRIGRIGHSELKSWSYLLSKQNLQKVTKQLKDMCKQCNLMYPPSILSACLVTLEPDAKLRVMPDQFTPDERFSQISMQNPLSTPQDVTCTHILVFPTSAVCLSFTRQFQNEPQVDIDNDFLNFDEFDEENDGCNNEDIMGAILGTWDYARSSPQGSPGRMEDNRSWQSSGGNNFNSAQQQDVEEVGSINQQPLAVGYMVSTAPTGRMPAWFWAACPHLEDVCPVFLKTALHLHVPNIQTADDTITVAHSSATDHPLDSTLTADVLRYVLEGYNALSWLALDSNTHDRLSCLPINVQTLMDLYYLTAAIA